MDTSYRNATKDFFMASSFPKVGLCESTHSKGLELAVVLHRNAVVHCGQRIAFSAVVGRIGVLGVQMPKEVDPS